MKLEYNGISLELLQFDRISRVNVYDQSGTDLMYVKWMVSATCIYAAGGGVPVGTAVRSKSNDTDINLQDQTATPGNRRVRGQNPDFTDFSGTNQEQNVAGGRPGYNAVITDVELRYRLSIPRGELKITAADSKTGNEIVWVHTPKPGYICDPMNGPKPLGPPDIIDVVGDGTTFGVHFQVEFATLPNPDKSDQVLLSHRWQMTHDHDDNYYSVRHVDGIAVFNMALLSAFNLEPDWFRNQLFHPIPLGYQRKLGPITLSPDGTTLRYSYSDVDTPITFDPGDSGATQISIIEQFRYNAPTFTRIAEGGK